MFLAANHFGLADIVSECGYTFSSARGRQCSGSQLVYITRSSLPSADCCTVPAACIMRKARSANILAVFIVMHVELRAMQWDCENVYPVRIETKHQHYEQDTYIHICRIMLLNFCSRNKKPGHQQPPYWWRPIVAYQEYPNMINYDFGLWLMKLWLVACSAPSHYKKNHECKHLKL